MTTRTQVVLSILGAAAVGTIIGLLIAPETGHDTRQRVKDITGKWVDQMGQLISKGKKEIKARAGMMEQEV